MYKVGFFFTNIDCEYLVFVGIPPALNLNWIEFGKL